MNVFKFTRSCLFAGLLMVGMAGCNKQSAETATVQGRWAGFEKDSTEKITIAFTGDRFTYWDAKTNELGSGTFVMNDAVQPRQMDLTFEKMLAPQYVGKVGLAIFELQDDELKFAGSEPGSTLRPTNIAGGDGIRTFTLKRE